MHLAWLIDLAVVLGYFTAIMGIGLYMGRREESLHDFALGGRRIPWWAVLASLIAAETSAGTFFGTPGEGYTQRNFTFLQLTIGTIIARVLVSFIFIKPYYDYNVYSIYEYLTARFGTATKNAASAVFLVTRVLASGSRLYVAAIALVLVYEAASGSEPHRRADPRHLHRRQRAPHRADRRLHDARRHQGRHLDGFHPGDDHDGQRRGGDVPFIFRGAGRLGRDHGVVVVPRIRWTCSSPADWTPNCTAGKRIKGMFETEYTVFAIIGSTFVTMGTHGTDQDMVQRMLTAPDIRRSRRSLILSGLADIPISLVFLAIGVLLFAYYQAHPDTGKPEATNEIFCYYILHQLPVGMRGLLLAGIFATAMGSLSTALNALATSFVRDWYLPYVNPDAGEHGTLRAVRRATVAFAVLMIVVSSVTSYLVIQRAEQNSSAKRNRGTGGGSILNRCRRSARRQERPRDTICASFQSSWASSATRTARCWGCSSWAC